MVYNCINIILNQLYPPTCLLCDMPSGQSMDICQGCLTDLPENLFHCRRCALPLPSNTAQTPLCAQCQKSPPPFELAFSPFLYQGPIRELISHFKFNEGLTAGALLSTLMTHQILAQKQPLPDLLIPIPLHPHRTRDRGYNQAYEIAKNLSDRLRIPVLATGCRRSKITPPQSQLSLKERQRNLKHAFEIVKPISAKRVALVDDVITTGSTMRALASLLKRHGVEQIQAWSIARTP